MITTAASRRSVLVLDVVVAIWVAAWVVVGVMVGANLRDLRQVSDTLESSSTAIDAVSSGLGPLSNIPVAGGQLDEVSDTLDQTAADVGRSADVTRSSLNELSVLLAIAISVIPSLPALAGYVPFRIRRIRDLRSVREALRDDDIDGIDRYLATRAVSNQPYHLLRAASDDPWADLEQHRFRKLALIELDRLGIADEHPALVGEGARAGASSDNAD